MTSAVTRSLFFFFAEKPQSLLLLGHYMSCCRDSIAAYKLWKYCYCTVTVLPKPVSRNVNNTESRENWLLKKVLDFRCLRHNYRHIEGYGTQSEKFVCLRHLSMEIEPLKK